MKIVHNIYDKLVDFESLFSAWRNFRLGKTRRRCVLEFGHNLEDNLFALKNDLETQNYRHGAYERFIVRDPKERIIHKAAVRDRVVHTMVARELEKIYRKSFISHSFSCQADRGQHLAVRTAEKMCREKSRNYTRNFWYLKCDIKKFFDNINHETLKEILSRKIKDEKFLWLISRILESFHTMTAGTGLPLGNFTSQWLGNIYLNELDYFIKQKLKIKHYIRYADDFLILGERREYLEKILTAVGCYLMENLKLILHPNKITLKKFTGGIDWLGYKILPHYVILRKQTEKRMLVKTREDRGALNAGMLPLKKYGETLNSYLGMLSHCSGFKLSDRLIFNDFVYDYAGKIF